MYLFRKLIVAQIFVVFAAGFEFLRLRPSSWWWIFLILGLDVGLTILFVCKFKLNKTFFHFLILPSVFALTSLFFLVFVVNPVIYHIFTLVASFVLYVLVRQYYYYMFLPYKYQPYSLESLSFYAIILAGFFLFSSGFGGRILLQLDYYLILSVLAIILIIATYQFFWINKVNLVKNWMFVVVVVLVVFQLFLAIMFLPTSYYVNGFILTVVYYALLGLSKSSFSGNLNRKTVVSYVTVGLGAIVAVLLTAKWS